MAGTEKKPEEFGPWVGGYESVRRSKRHKVSVWKNEKGAWLGESRFYGISLKGASRQATMDTLDAALREKGVILHDKEIA